MKSTTRPRCAHCSQEYGRRAAESKLVRWDTPTKEVPLSRGGTLTVAAEPAKPPPPYRGNEIVIKETHPYFSADDHRMVMYRYIWDGETWAGGYPPFCTLRCALDYARKAFRKFGPVAGGAK